MKKLLLILFLFACENTIVDRSSSGCTDESACNYDDSANEDDGSCEYYDVCEVCDGDGSTCINDGLVINEINYHSSEDFNPEDWVELYNPHEVPIEIGSWEFKDDNNDNVFIFPENTILDAKDYLVICKDLEAFSQIFPDVSNIIGGFEFGLDGAGEQVRLFNADEELVDKVEYDDSPPWPITPDGTGPTLELKNPSLDNALAENWAASANSGGTPGGINSANE